MMDFYYDSVFGLAYFYYESSELFLNIDAIPKNIDIEKIMHHIKKDRILLVNSFDENIHNHLGEQSIYFNGEKCNISMTYEESLQGFPDLTSAVVGHQNRHYNTLEELVLSSDYIMGYDPYDDNQESKGSMGYRDDLTSQEFFEQTHVLAKNYKK